MLGGGPIGAMYAMVLKERGGNPVIVSEPVAERRQEILALGADLAVDPGAEDLAETVLEATNGLGADVVVVDTVGALLPEALAILAKEGRVIVFGANRTAREIASPMLIMKEATVLGVFCADDNFPLAIHMLDQNRPRFERLVTHRFPLESSVRRSRVREPGRAMKPIVVLDDSEVALGVREVSSASMSVPNAVLQ